MELKMKKLLLGTLFLASVAAPALARDDFDHRFDRPHTCRGIITINGTDQSSLKEDGSRLVRKDDITASCLFLMDTKEGKQIMNTCRMGYGCIVKAIVNSESSDVNYVLKVYSVRLVK
jgi:hypothetical protein